MLQMFRQLSSFPRIKRINRGVRNTKNSEEKCNMFMHLFPQYSCSCASKTPTGTNKTKCQSLKRITGHTVTFIHI